MGMTGNQDTAAETDAWCEAIVARLKAEVEDSVRALEKGDRLKSGDVVGADRKARAVGSLMRTVRQFSAHARSARGGREASDENKDEMGEGDDSPETCERLRHALESDFDRLHGRLEAAGVAVEPGCWPTARTEGCRVRSA